MSADGGGGGRRNVLNSLQPLPRDRSRPRLVQLTGKRVLFLFALFQGRLPPAPREKPVLAEARVSASPADTEWTAALASSPKHTESDGGRGPRGSRAPVDGRRPCEVGVAALVRPDAPTGRRGSPGSRPRPRARPVLFLRPAWPPRRAS